MSQQAQTGLLERGVGGLYDVRSDADHTVYTLRARGILRKQGRTPMVGDHVRFTPGSGEEHGWLEDILPRRNEIKRPPVANVDLLCIVVAPEPEPDLLLVDRLLIWARQEGITPLLLLNKWDLNPQILCNIEQQYRGAEVEVIKVSAARGTGLSPLLARLQDRVSCFAGQSAVGKSSLLNALFDFSLPVGAVSRKTERGRHTTRHVSLLRAGGAMVLDTPGFSLLDLWPTLEPEAVSLYYPEFGPYASGCRFQPCMHDQEPDCAVRCAVEAENVDARRYGRYLLLLRQVREHWRGRYG